MTNTTVRDLSVSPITLIRGVLTKEIEEALLALRDRENLTKWDIGRVTNAIWKQVTRHRLKITKNEVYIFVSHEVDIQVRSPSSIKQYARVASFFPNHIEEKYPVDFAHFVLAAQYGKDWEVALTVSCELMDRHFGNLPSVAEVQRELELRGYIALPDDDEEEDDDEDGGNEEEESAQLSNDAKMVLRRDLHKLYRLTTQMNTIVARMKPTYPSWAKAFGRLSSNANSLARQIEENLEEKK